MMYDFTTLVWAILFSVGSGMLLGAWIAARGFEKSMVSMMNDPDASWNKEED